MNLSSRPAPRGHASRNGDYISSGCGTTSEAIADVRRFSQIWYILNQQPQILSYFDDGFAQRFQPCLYPGYSPG